MGKTKVSRKDIADLAGVSGAAVTYALSSTQSNRVSDKTRERIVKLAEELGYRPFFSGKTLSTGKSFNLGVLLPSEHFYSSQHVMAIVSGIAGKLSRSDYNLILFQTNEMEKCLTSVDCGRIDGLFTVGAQIERDVERLPENFPMVVVDGQRDVRGFKNVRNVRSDHEGMIRDSFDYFISKSCRNVLGVLNSSYRHNRASNAAEAFVDECGRRAADIFGSVLKPSVNFNEQIRGMLKAEQKWDAFLVDHDCLSNLLVEALADAGMREGVDYHMIVHSTANQRYSCEAYRSKVACGLLYLQRELDVGEEAWRAMEDMLNGRTGDDVRLVPYQLSKTPEREPPCYWNSGRAIKAWDGA